METHIPSIFTIITNSEDETQILVDAETGEIILTGDYYHDHIEDQIAGFFQCMDYFGYPYQMAENVNE